ncbi:DUF3408 domain-containing protein [Flavobacterium plurextorum]|uniref:DUF3408 domain-containing protein n=1 Tax=Flavobacterium plurextorum TaxID=1114867 RepID=UPI003757692F
MKKHLKNKKALQNKDISGVTAEMNERTYEKAFLQMNEIQKRGSKSIYLSAENHERLTRIVQIVGEDKIPLFAYLNNILEHHFRVFEETITKEFKEKYKRLF